MKKAIDVIGFRKGFREFRKAKYGYFFRGFSIYIFDLVRDGFDSFGSTVSVYDDVKTNEILMNKIKTELFLF